VRTGGVWVQSLLENNPSPSWLVVATTQGHADMIDEDDFKSFALEVLIGMECAHSLLVHLQLF